jgi:hypothetical protein
MKKTALHSLKKFKNIKKHFSIMIKTRFFDLAKAAFFCPDAVAVLLKTM